MARVLYIDPFLPIHDRNSGSLRLYRILQLLKSERHDVTFMPRAIFQGHEPVAYDLMNQGIEVLHPADGLHTPESIAAALSGRQFDTVFISFHSLAAMCVPIVRAQCPSAKVIVDTIDLHFVRERRQAELAGDKDLARKAEQTYQSEIAAYRSADALIAISETERATLQAELPDTEIFVVPNVHGVVESTPPFEQRCGLVFVGNFWHPPNGEGIWWFCNTVWPEVQRRIPGVTLDIVGQDPPQELKRFESPQLRVRGWVPSTEPFLNTARLSIAPLLHGAGLKGKVGEALSVGLPVITTSVGAEGLGLIHNENAMIADDPSAFADAVTSAHTSPELWKRLAENGREVIRRSYTPDVVRDAIRKILPISNQFFAVPDWNDIEPLRATLQGYFECNTGKTSTLHIGVYGVDIQTATNQLVEIITGLGYDPATIPDVNLLPAPSLNFGSLNPNLVWVPMRADVPKPAHVTSQTNFATLAHH